MREGAAAANWVSKHCVMPRFVRAVSCVLLDWVHGLLMCVAGNVVVLSSIKIDVPTSSEGTWYYFRTYKASSCCMYFCSKSAF
jgi:hypothetical protein